MKKLVVVLIVISIISVIGYFLLLYGGHRSQAEGGHNIYLLIGEVLMWPWLVLDAVQKYINPENKVLGLYSSWIFQYVGYLMLFYLYYALKNKFYNTKNKGKNI